MKTIYLAGPMTNLGGKNRDHAGQIVLAEWRKEVMNRVHGYVYLYPEMAEWEANSDEIDHAPKFDIDLIKKCDSLIAFLDEPGRIGTQCEISAAYALGKTIGCVYIYNMDNYPVPWFIEDLIYGPNTKSIEMIPYQEGEPEGRPENIAGNMEAARAMAIDEIVKLLGGDRVDYYDYIRSSAWKEKADAAKERAGNRCQVCNKTGRLDAHHRTYERLGKELPEDITVLCHNCHSIYEMNRKAEEKR